MNNFPGLKDWVTSGSNGQGTYSPSHVKVLKGAYASPDMSFHDVQTKHCYFQELLEEGRSIGDEGVEPAYTIEVEDVPKPKIPLASLSMD